MAARPLRPAVAALAKALREEETTAVLSTLVRDVVEALPDNALVLDAEQQLVGLDEFRLDDKLHLKIVKLLVDRYHMRREWLDRVSGKN